MLNRIRRRIDAAVERRVDELMDARIGRFEEELARTTADYEARLGGTQADFSFVRSEYDRLAPQVAALEHRLEWLRARGEDTAVDPEGALQRAQAEHERARIRLEIAAHYEERLRRLESADS